MLGKVYSRAFVAIRPARLEDAPAMARVSVDTFFSAHGDQLPREVLDGRRTHWTYADSERAFRRDLEGLAADSTSRDCFLVATDDATDEIVGVGVGIASERGLFANAGEVIFLYVRQSHQGCGLGRGLVRTIATHLVRHGMTSLVITVLDANAPARQFYEALGGRIVGEGKFEDEGMTLREVVYGWDDIRTLALAE
jgi:ribosomal protein S18 acetylase RimI-like enzyme